MQAWDAHRPTEPTCAHSTPQSDDTLCLEMLAAPRPWGWQALRDASPAQQIRMLKLWTQPH